MLDLLKFIDEDGWPGYDRIHVLGGWKFATNGKALAAIATEECNTHGECPDARGLIAKINATECCDNVPDVSHSIKCIDCDGKGFTECECCGHDSDCEDCNATGVVELCEYRGELFDNKFVKLICGLTGVKCGMVEQNNGMAMAFKCDGGWIGCVMSLFRDAINPVPIEADDE